MRTPRSRWIARAAVATAGLTMIAAGCGVTTPADNAGDSSLVDLYTFAAGPPDHIDPGLTVGLEGAQITNLLFDGLTSIDAETGEAVPWLADSITPDDTGAEWTFQVRSEATFSDGSPVLPSDFAYAWQRASSAELASDVAYLFDVIADTDGELTGVVADDDAGTLTVTLERPFFDFPSVVSHTAFSPVPKDQVEALADQSSWEHGDMVGDGPYKLASSWKAGEGITLERNDDYWGGPDGSHEASIDTIEFRASQDVQSAYTDFQAGTGEVAAIPPGQFMNATDEYDNVVQPLLQVDLFVFNMDDAVVGGEDNVELRRAISSAIDRTALNDAAYDGAYAEATGVTPPGVTGYRDDVCDTCTFDQAKAGDALSEAGGAPSESITLSYPSSGSYDDIVTVMQANLADVDIDVTLDPIDPDVYFDTLFEGSFQLAILPWAYDYPVYDGGISSLFLTDGEANVGRYSNPEFDALVEEARSTADADTRTDLYQQAERIMFDDQAALVTLWPTSQIVHRSSVDNVVVSPIGFIEYDELTTNS